MRKYLTYHSKPEELMRLKKSLWFIQEVIRSYETGGFAHVGFSCALAISKAEELRDRILPSSQAYQLFGKLVLTLRELYEGRGGFTQAKNCLKVIRDHFKLDRYSIIRRQRNKPALAIAT